MAREAWAEKEKKSLFSLYKKKKSARRISLSA